MKPCRCAPEAEKQNTNPNLIHITSTFPTTIDLTPSLDYFIPCHSAELAAGPYNTKHNGEPCVSDVLAMLWRCFDDTLALCW